jgi:hypothetical protein
MTSGRTLSPLLVAAAAVAAGLGITSGPLHVGSPGLLGPDVLLFLGAAGLLGVGVLLAVADPFAPTGRGLGRKCLVVAGVYLLCAVGSTTLYEAHVREQLQVAASQQLATVRVWPLTLVRHPELPVTYSVAGGWYFFVQDADGRFSMRD